ncbi:MAG: 1,4-alpha-glucan branching protein GlgB [Pseudomonadota bacterium]
MLKIFSPQAPQETAFAALVAGRHGDPFALLGPHRLENGHGVIRAFVPDALGVDICHDGAAPVPARRIHPAGLFVADIAVDTLTQPYRLRVHRPDGPALRDDPYRFPSLLGPEDHHFFAEGTHLRLYERLGARQAACEGVNGVHFAVWAPNALRVSVVGDFNQWDGRRHVMRRHPGSGLWDIFLPHVMPGALYKFEILASGGALLPLKADPFARRMEGPPHCACLVEPAADFAWSDDAWMRARGKTAARDAPISIYEAHVGSWRRHDKEDRALTLRELAETLVPYVKDMGFSHIELMPVSAHPFGGSWGYQPLGLFAPCQRYGTPDDLRAFVNRAHEAGLGVILDWVVSHFPDDPHGLACFDGTALYEHADPRQNRHPDWDTLVYNYGRTEVANFLVSNALFWLDRYHIDGLRVDAVASMLYLDYSRQPGTWLPNAHGGRENLDAIAFLRRLNETVYGAFPDVFTIAEESTAWPMVTRPTHLGGLGFGYKWNMGWMNDTLRYMRRDPAHRKFHHGDLTFGLLYAFHENFILPLSHDEVVHGKGALLAKMPGDRWQQFANLRAYLAFQFTQPGKKLLFMGGEFAQAREWDHDGGLDWHLLADPAHQGIQTLVGDLNRLYRRHGALHQRDCDGAGFAWIEANDQDNSVIAYLRFAADGADHVLIMCNFTPVPRHGYRLGVPHGGHYREVINSDSAYYGGGNMGNGGLVETKPVPAHGQPQSLVLTVPPLATLILAPS